MEKKVRVEKIHPYELGITGEKIAHRFLSNKNYKIIEKGFRLYRGEIDIVAYDGRTLVFVEVKTRRSHTAGFPEDAVTLNKQKQIKKIALGYCALKNQLEVESRFDVISVYFDKKDGFSISHIEDAF